MEEAKKKYIIANIKIPIEIENHEIKYLNEYANVTFETSSILPQKTSNEIDIKLLQKLLNNEKDLNQRRFETGREASQISNLLVNHTEDVTGQVPLQIFNGIKPLDNKIYLNISKEEIKNITPLKNLIRTADYSSSRLPVTDLNEAPQRGADSNLHRYNRFYK